MTKADRGEGAPADGVLGMDYARARVRDRAPRYRLARRTREICRAFETYCATAPADILDLGSADGRMLGGITERFPGARAVGVEYNGQLVETAGRAFPDIRFIEGDIQALPLADASFDAASAAAVIEHVPDPDAVFRETRRVLRPEGVFALTAPDPFWESVAVRLGHLEKEQHHHVMNLRELHALAERHGFEVLEATRFMLSPVGMPLELPIERALRALRLGRLMANQLLVLRRPS